MDHFFYLSDDNVKERPVGASTIHKPDHLRGLSVECATAAGLMQHFYQFSTHFRAVIFKFEAKQKLGCCSLSMRLSSWFCFE